MEHGTFSLNAGSILDFDVKNWFLMQACTFGIEKRACTFGCIRGIRGHRTQEYGIIHAAF
jgi:hypothetical protein